MNAELHALVDRAKEDVLRWRRHLHEYPELAFEEHATARYIMDELSAFPHCAIAQPTPTSVLVSLKGARPGKTVALRADIDALAIEEQSGVPFSSKNRGIMHACGHDAHTAMLMGAVKMLSALQHRLQGEVRFIFQHAEELPPGGARELVAQGIMDGVDMVFGLHVWATQPTGTVWFEPGVFCASVDDFDLYIRGRGGHASMPHMAIDPIMVGAHIHTALQTIVSRRLDPAQAAVVTVATFEANGGYNVIPETVHLAGTVRSHVREHRTAIPRMIDETIEGICAAFGAEHDMQWRQDGYPVGMNAPKAVDVARTVVEQYLPECRPLRGLTPMFGGEDFARYADRVPGCFLFLGCGNDAIGANKGLHTPQFVLDERVMDFGLAVHVGIVDHLLVGERTGDNARSQAIE